MENNLVNIDWLKDNLEAENLVILDATIPKATDKNFIISTTCIPNTIFFDLKKVFSEQNSELPNTVPTAEHFENETKKLGINNDSEIVIYDQHGVYSSPRAWWLFKLMGHKKVYVLNGGLPEWKKANLPLQTNFNTSLKEGNYKANYNANLFESKSSILNKLSEKQNLIIDARSNKRFLGTEPEPREGLRAGHIPNSCNLNYAKLIDNHKLASTQNIQAYFNELEYADKKIIYSCGSGITACILALAGTQIGINEFSVYDGSWTEWGASLELPIEK